MSLTSLLVDPRAHAAVILALALLRVVYAIVSRAVAPYPRLRAAVEAVAALGPDVIRAGQQAAAVLAGRPVASLDLRAPDPALVAALARAEAAERRIAELSATAPAAPVERVDTSRAGRATIAPGLLVLALAVAAEGCHPRLPPVSGCTPLAQRCDGDRPAVCSQTQRWEPAGDRTCASVGGACVVTAGVAHCAVADGGAP